jgi:cytidylate kinase
MSGFTIAIDGPAASGKGTLARQIARKYGFHHLDTGLTYRATAKALIDAGLPLDDEAVAARVAGEVDLGALDRRVLAAHEIGEAASRRKCGGHWSRRNAALPSVLPARCSTDATSARSSAPMRI